MTEQRRRFTWEDAAGIEERGLLSELTPEEAMAIASDVSQRPVLGGKSVDPSLIDPDIISAEFISRYAEATFARDREDALQTGRAARAVAEESVVPALCRASSVSESAYAVASAWRDDGDPSLMLDLYSNFLATL